MFTLNDKIKDGIVYTIAEMSANHGGKLEQALEIVRRAADAGADCVKIQTYTADTLTIDCDNDYFRIRSGLWDGYKLHDLYSHAYTPWEWQESIKQECKRCGIDFLSTPFDRSAVDFLESINCEAYKIASFELVDLPLIEYTASKGKPMIISCGMGSIEEIQDAIDACRRVNNNNVILLKCCSEYPAAWEDMHFGNIPDMMERFQVPVGLSDHSMGSLGAVVGVTMGACVVEKHICLSRQQETPDSAFSMEIEEFAQMVKDINHAKLISRGPDYTLTKKETASTIFRRSIFAVKDIEKGEKFTTENIRIIRPGYGMKPKYYNSILGQKASEDIRRGTPITENKIEKGVTLFLTNNSNSVELYEWILAQGYPAIMCSEPIDIEDIRRMDPVIIVSYNYSSIIKKDIIEYMKGRIINLHISLLPWNKGANPNFWSFMENSPKGVTIHQIDDGLDTGDIIYQKEVNLDATEETFATSYQKLQDEITSLFKAHWKEIYSGDYQLIPQEGKGSYHSISKFKNLKSKMSFEWCDNVAATIEKYKKI